MNLKRWLICLLLGIGIAVPAAQAQNASTLPGLIIAPSVFDHGTLTTSELLKRKRKILKPRHNTLAVGLVGGGPVGFGARGVLRLGQFGIAADLAYNRLRDDQGDKVGAFTMKADARLYAKGLISKLIRPYTFVGVTTQRGRFDESLSQSVYLMDAGFGAGIKLFRLEVGAEAGILIPVHQLDDYRPGIGAFVNANVLIWLF